MVYWGQIRVDKPKLGQLMTTNFFSFGQLFIWIGAINDQIGFPMGQSSDSEQCSNRLQLDLITILVKFACELGPKMTRYDFIEARRAILSSVQIDSQLYLISLLVNFSFELGLLLGGYGFPEVKRVISINVRADSNLTWLPFCFVWIGVINDQIWLPRGKTSDFEQCSNRFQLHLILLLVNFSLELGKIMYDFLEVKWVIWIKENVL